MEDLIRAVSQVGFPIVVAMYSLIRLEKSVKDNTRVSTAVLEQMRINKHNSDRGSS